MLMQCTEHFAQFIVLHSFRAIVSQVQVPLQDAVSMVKELDQYMDLAVEELKGLFQVAVYYHIRRLCHALTAKMLVWTVKVRY